MSEKSWDRITVEVVDGWLDEPPRIRVTGVGQSPTLMMPAELPSYIQSWASGVLGDMAEEDQIPGPAQDAARDELERLEAVHVLGG